MRRYIMPERVAWAKLRPNDSRGWHQLRVICGYLALIVVFVVVALFLKNRHRADMEQNWESATAVIEDVRPKIVSQVNNEGGAAMFYQVVVLAKYNTNNGEQERWITVEQRPESLSEAQLQAFRWKGKQCVVRWKPSDPNNVIAEVS